MRKDSSKQADPKIPPVPPKTDIGEILVSKSDNNNPQSLKKNASGQYEE